MGMSYMSRYYIPGINKLAGYKVKPSFVPHQAAEARITLGAKLVLLHCTLCMILQYYWLLSQELTARLLGLYGVVTGKSFAYETKFMLKIKII